MSFGFPALKPRSINPSHTECKEGPYGIPDVMSNGLYKTTSKIGAVHPIQAAVQNGAKLQEELNMNMMRDIQGIHAPLRLAMELRSFKDVGRLPFLPSSNLSTDVLRGRDDYIDFTDILYPPDVHERLVQPHAVMDRKIGIL